MNKQRLEQIITSYGSQPGNWPPEERDAALALLADSEDLRNLQQAEKQLDDYLYPDLSFSAFSSEQAKVVARKVSNRLSEEKQPGFLTTIIHTLTQPRYAVALSAVIAVSVVLFSTAPSGPVQDTVSPEFDDWMLMQLTGVETTEEQATLTGFMDLVELEVADGTGI